MFKRFPLAITSLLLGVLSFIHLFGLEKAVFAVILGGLALREVVPGQEKGKKYAYAGIILGSLYVVILLVIMVIKGPGIVELIGKLR
ncbi:MAG: DUF4190 domain-containing protein [Endomicrobiales bacterium]